MKVPMKICEKNLTHVGFLKFLGDKKAISEKISSILGPFFFLRPNLKLPFCFVLS